MEKTQSTEMVTIQAEKRDGTGKSLARKLRAEGKIPGNIIGQGKAESISLDPKELSKAWKADKQFKLKYNGSVKDVKIHELQINAIKRTPLHVDLMYVNA